MRNAIRPKPSDLHIDASQQQATGCQPHPQGVIAAARDADFVIADRATPIPTAILESLPKPRIVMRSAIDVRNIDVAAASNAGVLVTYAEAGFVTLVVELTLGFLVARGITRAATTMRG